jgi:hypothetical protein
MMIELCDVKMTGELSLYGLPVGNLEWGTGPFHAAMGLTAHSEYLHWDAATIAAKRAELEARLASGSSSAVGSSVSQMS